MSSFLRRTRLLDAVATGATGLTLLAGAGLLAEPLGLPATLLRGAGLLLVPFIGLVAWAALRPVPLAAASWAIIGCNAGWVSVSLALLVGGWIAPTVLGTAFVIAQAVIVGVLAELQLLGLRRTTAAA